MLRLLIFAVFIPSINGLSPFLTYYEPLNYRTSDLARFSRSAQPHDTVRIVFDAFNRTFKLRLRKISPEELLFIEDSVVQFNNGSMTVDRDVNLYKGSIEGDGHSYVYGSIHSGVFNGAIETGEGKEYGVECSIRHNSSAPFHSFIYDVAHIKMLNRRKTKRPISPSESESESMCGLSDPKIAESIRLDKDKSSIPPFRSKRENKLHDVRMCTVYFHVDHLLYEHYNKKYKTEASSRLRAMVFRELEAVRKVYEETDFGGVKGITFRVFNIKIWDNPSDPDYPFKEENVDVNGFLARNAMEDYGKVCLGYVMTYRDFSGGTLGLAFVGGLCSVYRESKEQQRSTNAGIVTYLNFGSPVLERISYLTLAHEIGHNFGSNHDETDECKGGNDGQFIMWYAATSGDQPNNKRFSECSKKQMTAKLHEILAIDPKANSKHERNCFLESGAPICGNGVVEKGEECDCGNEEECKKTENECCVPQGKGADECKLQPEKPGKKAVKCSPSQGSCCNAKCEFKPETEECKQKEDCSLASKCDGTNYACPPPEKANDNLPCDDATGMCQDGICNKTMLCSTVPGFTECETPEQTCLRYCKKSDGACTSTAELDEFKDAKFKQKGRWGQPGVMLGLMSHCFNSKGTCDQFDMCNKVQATGQMRKKFQEFASFFQGLSKKWWVIAIIVIVVVALLVVVIKFCSYATPSSNPNKPKAKSIKEIKNMMSDRVKNMSKRAQRKLKKVKGGTSKTPAGSAQTPAGTAQTPGGSAQTPGGSAQTPGEKSKKTNEDDE